MKKFGGHEVHQPLNFAFSMVETGGSTQQKYNAVNGEFSPDRGITPWRCQPKLIVEDPDGLIPTGDYATSLVNVVWTLTLVSDRSISTLLQDTKLKTTPYRVDSYNAVNIYYNIPLGYVMHVEFRADYYNAERGQTQHFEWSKDMKTLEQSDTNITIELRMTPKKNFSPFKTYGPNNHFPIEAVVKNGDSELTADQSVIKWQVFDKSLSTPAWRDIDADENLWYVSGKDSGKLIINVDFLNKALLKVTGQAKNGSTQTASASTLLRRWYGQWDDDYGFVYSQFLTQDTKRTAVYAKITNRQGDIKNPQKYFDIQLFYRDKSEDEWTALGNGTEFEVEKEKISGNHEAGGVTRELSAFIPIVFPDGSVLADPNGNPICGQFPTSEIEMD